MEPAFKQNLEREPEKILLVVGLACYLKLLGVY